MFRAGTEKAPTELYAVGSWYLLVDAGADSDLRGPASLSGFITLKIPVLTVLRGRPKS